LDQELIAYLDKRFESVDQRFETMDQRLKDLRWEMNARFERVDRRFEELEKTVHLDQTMTEELRDEIRMFAEGMMTISDLLEHHMTDAQVTKLSRRVTILEERAERETRDVFEVLREKYGSARG
jgi:predicted  nucleic acid-binding Zn-ribbon protein